MSEVQSPDEVIEEFAQAIAEHYLATRHQSDDDTKRSEADAFVSRIESGLRSKLRDRISSIEAAQQVDDTPTIDSDGAELSQPGSESADDLEATLDTPDLLSLDATAELNPNKPVDRINATDELAATSDGTPNDSAFSYETQAENENNGSANRVHRGSNASTEPMLAPPEYEIISTLGEGGMGVVYKARHIPLNRLVAVKMIISGASATKTQLSRFQREAEAAARLSHPNIVSIYEVGQFQNLPYFSLEFVDGNSLSEMLRNSTLSEPRAAELLVPIAKAVHYSHQMGVLHRDLKPQNLLLTADGIPKVADFGLAKRLDDDGDDDEKTRAGAILGTPGYLAPEQAERTERVGPHTDVYALGCILYYMMTGRPPYRAPTALQTVQQMLKEEPVPPSRLQPGLDRDLETICMKALEKEIPRRYQTAEEFADELQRFLDGTPILARPITRSQRLWKWCKRNPRVATLSALACTLLLCLLVGGLVSSVVINQQKLAEQAARQEAEANAKLAEDQAELAMDTTRMILYETKEFFKAKPELSPLRKSMLNTILDQVEQIHDGRYTTDVSEIFTASADSQLGQIYLEAGSYQKALDRLLAAEEKLHRIRNDGYLFQADISEMNLTLALADTYRKLGELEKSKEQYLKLQRLRNAYFEKYPQISRFAVAQSMAEVYGRLAVIHRELGEPEKALESILKSVAARRDAFEQYPDASIAIRELAGALSALSVTYERAGNFEKMIDANREALSLQLKLAESQSDVSTMHNIAKDQKVLGRQCMLLDNDTQAEPTLESAASTFEQLLKVAPDNQSIREQAVDSYYYLGVAKSRLEKDATPSFNRAEELQREVIAASDTVMTRGMLLKILARNAKTEQAEGILEELTGDPKEPIYNCGYAAVAFALLSEHVEPDNPKRDQLVELAIEWTRKLIRRGYRDFQAMRETDLDFEPLQQNEAFLAMLADEEARSK